MISSSYKTKYLKLLHIQSLILQRGLDLRSSLVQSVWGFVLPISIKNNMKKLLQSFAFSAVFLVVLVPSLSFADFSTSLKYGSRGQAVSDLQDFLQDQGSYTGKIDGKFGLGTLKSVKAWQTANQLTPDGYFGFASRTKANVTLASLLDASNATELAETGTIAPVATVDGCTSTTGFSTTTGLKCDGTLSAPQQVTDAGIQAKLDALTAQLQTIANNTTPVVQSPVMEPIAPTCSIKAEMMSSPNDQFKLSWTSENAVEANFRVDWYGNGKSSTMFDVTKTEIPNRQIKEDIEGGSRDRINLASALSVNYPPIIYGIFYGEGSKTKTMCQTQIEGLVIPN